MSLRWRLALTTLGVGLPILLVVTLGYRVAARRVMDNTIVTLVRARFPAEAQADCETRLAPQRHRIQLPGHGPFLADGLDHQVEVFFFDTFGHSPSALAPPLPNAMLDVLRQGASIASEDVERNGQQLRYVMLPMFGDTSCSFALAVAPDLRRPLPPLPVILVPALMALLAVVIGIAPIVRRARSLTLAVREWQQGGADPPIDSKSDELGELSRAFRDAANTVAAREQDLREFVENVSHDLATPLTVLQGHLASLANVSDPDVIHQAMNEAHYLGALLGSLSITAKFETGVLIGEVIDLRTITTRVVTRHQAQASRLEISLECAVPDDAVLASGDITFTEQALTNLLGNALRYNREGKNVAVVLDVVGDEFSLKVLDDGPGLTEEERGRVLLRGERGDSARSRDSGGRGLGLSIVARVAIVHDWKFSLDHNQPHGLVAELRGPLRGVPEE